MEDINQDYTLNEYEKYYQYRIAIHPDSLVVASEPDENSELIVVQVRHVVLERVCMYEHL